MNRPSDIAVAAAFWEAYGDLLPSTLDDLFSRARELDTEPRAGDGDAFSRQAEARMVIVNALCASKGWMHEYAEAYLDDFQYGPAIAAQRNEGDV